MKVSHNWLQDYFKDKIPEPEKLASLFTFHAFEVEGIESAGDDTVLDIKVLPDRANYALSHRGIAREISFVTDLEIDKNKINLPNTTAPGSNILELDIHGDACRRDSKAVITNIINNSSPAWLKEKLEVLGQKSINLVVDATNYVMLDMGQPLHAFDLDKLTKKDEKVKIVLNPAKKDEKITILGGKELVLDEGVLIFADGNNNDLPLDIAGIKGGTAAEINASTNNIVILSANFEPSYIRKISTKVGVKTDASKRSENGIPTELTMDGLMRVASIILKESPGTKLEGIVDYYPAQPKAIVIKINLKQISELLGVDIKKQELESIFKKLDFDFTKESEEYLVKPPYYRLDVKIPEDIVEEVGRIYGYEKIPAKLSEKPKKPAAINKTYYWTEKIKDILAKNGFSEVFTYSLTNKGEVEIQNPLASDKNMLRSSLSSGISSALALNARNADLLGLDQIKIFEIGTIFKKDKEYLELGIGVQNIKKLKQKEGQAIRDILEKISKETGADTKNTIQDNVSVYTLSVSKLIEDLPDSKKWDVNPVENREIKYQPISAYPYIVRDIAVFVPESTPESELVTIIKSNAGELLVKNYLFDVFTKEIDGNKKTSYASRLVFQSHNRTLTDDEINKIMEKITSEMNAREGWIVR